MKLYREEQAWILDRPQIEICAAYHPTTGNLVFSKQGERRSIHITFYESPKLLRSVFTHWHPPLESLAIYGHEDAPLSYTDIGAGLNYGCAELRAVTSKSVHRFIYPKLSLKSRNIALQDFEYEFANIDFRTNSILQERFVQNAAKLLGAKYLKITLDKR